MSVIIFTILVFIFTIKWSYSAKATRALTASLRHLSWLNCEKTPSLHKQSHLYHKRSLKIQTLQTSGTSRTTIICPLNIAEKSPIYTKPWCKQSTFRSTFSAYKVTIIKSQQLAHYAYAFSIRNNKYFLEY